VGLLWEVESGGDTTWFEHIYDAAPDDEDEDEDMDVDDEDQEDEDE
jgi:hypothetical protein